MVRKHYFHTRLRAKRSRPKTPAPTSGWLIAELAQLTQLPLRTLRNYAHRKLIAPIELRGTLTRYPRRELLSLLGIMRMRSQTRLKLTEIKRQLDSLGNDQLEAWLRTGPLPPLAATALGLAANSGNTAALAQSNMVHAVHASDELPAAHTDTWQRVQLLPGLELLLWTAANPAVRRAAQNICSEYRSR